MNFWTLADRFPPILCRLLARHRAGAPLTVADIARVSGLSVQEVTLIARQTNWEYISLPYMARYLTGCGIDFCNPVQMHRIREYLRYNARTRTPWSHLRKSPDWASTFEPMLAKYKDSLITR